MTLMRHTQVYIDSRYIGRKEGTCLRRLAIAILSYTFVSSQILLRF